MKKIVLIIPLFITSTYVVASSPDTDMCGPALTATKLQLVPYIYQIINANIDGAYKLEELQELVGMEVSGLHRFYPEGANHQEQTLVTGKIADIKPFKAISPGKTIYQMIIHSKKHGLGQFLFSGTYSPAFSTLETTSIPRNTPLGTSIENAVAPSFNLLSIGLDTPPEVVAYKNSLSEAVVFYGQRYKFYEFANFYDKVPILIGGQLWPSTEHYFQAQKFINTDPEYAMKIRAASSPAEAARMGRDRSHPIRPDWEEVKDEIMLKTLAAKFTQHKHLYDLLMSTGDALIVEHTERDRYWGDGENGKGKSMLGNLLMKLRDELFKKGMMIVIDPYEYTATLSIPRAVDLVIDSIRAEDSFRTETSSSLISDLSREVASSNLSDIEKIDRLQMILGSASFTLRRQHNTLNSNRTSSDEWIAFINAKYPEDLDFRYQLIRINVVDANPGAMFTRLSSLDIPNDKKIEIYKTSAHDLPDSFIRALPDSGLNDQDLKELYLYALQFSDYFILFSASIEIIENFPQGTIDDAFIQKVVAIINKHSFPQALLGGSRSPKSIITEKLIEVAASHGLNYRAIDTDNKINLNLM